MAHGRKTGGRDFPKGAGGNPERKGYDRPDVREAKKANSQDVSLMLTKLLKYSRGQLVALLKAGDTSSMELMVASLIVKAIQNGDYARMTFIFDRAFGKVKDVHEFQGSVHAALVSAMKDLGES